MRKSRLFRASALVVLTVMMVQVMSCGTIIYPERRHQPKGNIDVGIALLDGIGLLFFLIPGIIAYAVDFSTNAIYVPPGQAMAVPPTFDLDTMTVVRMDPEHMDRESIQQAIADHTGRDIDLDSDQLRVYEIDENGSFVPRDTSDPIPYTVRGDS